jgi:hypothetical protein
LAESKRVVPQDHERGHHLREAGDRHGVLIWRSRDETGAKDGDRALTDRRPR